MGHTMGVKLAKVPAIVLIANYSYDEQGTYLPACPLSRPAKLRGGLSVDESAEQSKNGCSSR